MSFKQPLFALGLALSAVTFNANATLTSYSANGVDLVYSSVSDVTWTKDANLLGSLIIKQGYNTVVNAIINASPVVSSTPNIYDTPYRSGHHNVTFSDFGVGGNMNWFGAKAFVNYLNSVQYGGSSQWDLPNSDKSSIEQLYYNELQAPKFGPMPNSNKFINEQAGSYWETELTQSSNAAGLFNFAWGQHGFSQKNEFNHYDFTLSQYYSHFVWAVTPGHVSAVPMPSAVWLFVTGLAGLLGPKRRGLTR